ncbi:MAG: ABC transporter ATP-binding protein [Gemmatimonadota bacterium]
MSLLEIRGLKTYLDTSRGLARAVDGVDLTVQEGEALGIVGESGSGKSLLALSIPGLQPRSRESIQPGSSVRFRGRELVGAPPGVMRRIRGREVAMIFQEPMTSLNPVHSVGSQIGEALTLHKGLKGRAREKEVLRLLREVGISEARLRARAYPHQLSGGMRQRAMIAMALAGDPALLVADEPTTALDVTVQAQILDLLDRIREDRGMALILISHDLRMVARICRRVLVMYAGRIVESGETSTVLSRPRHPYTRGLLGSRLSIRDRRQSLRSIPGEVPEAISWPRGCRFHPRCPEVVARCRAEEPEPTGAGPDAPGTGQAEAPEAHLARCWFPWEERR